MAEGWPAAARLLGVTLLITLMLATPIGLVWGLLAGVTGAGPDAAASPLFAVFGIVVVFGVFWTYIALLPCAPIAVAERRIVSALRLGLALTKGERLRILGVMAVAVVMALLCGLGIGAIVGGVTAAVGPSLIVATLGSAAFALVNAAVAAVQTVVYVRLRAMKDLPDI